MNETSSRDHIWLLPPYLGVIVATALAHMADWQGSESRTYVWLIGLFLIGPYAFPLGAILLEKTTKLRGITWGLIAPAVFWPLLNLLVSVIVSVAKDAV